MTTPPTTQGKAIGESFPVNQNSKTRATGKLREEAEHCPDHIFFSPLSQETYLTTHRSRKGSLEAKGE